jgi:hypothetical protein
MQRMLVNRKSKNLYNPGEGFTGCGASYAKVKRS